MADVSIRTSKQRSEYSEKFLGLDFDFNYDKIYRQLDDVGQKLLPKVASRLINNAAFNVRRRLIAYTDEIFDKPNQFTRNAWLVDKARPIDGDRMSAAIKAKPYQAAYLQFQIFGTQRHTGDAGSGPYDLFAWSAQKTQYGGVDRKYLKKLAREHRKERKARAAMAAKRKALGHIRPEERYGKSKRLRVNWTQHTKGKGGIFFGEVHGLKGYWRRPDRHHAEYDLHDDGRIKKGWSAPKLGSKNRSYTVEGQRLQLLFAVKSTVNYKKRFEFDKEVAEAFAQSANQAAFNEQMRMAREGKWQRH
ncbi:hypothetical protein ABIA25_002890 [Sinorhizobium fredii]|uniref:hypothetical protein n=1 Tax=Rhizobium fredii TaxID=380 RepID=UPI0035130C5B